MLCWQCININKSDIYIYIHTYIQSTLSNADNFGTKFGVRFREVSALRPRHTGRETVSEL